MNKLYFNAAAFIVVLVTLVGRVASQQEVCSQTTGLTSFTPAIPTSYPFGGLFIDIGNRIPCDSLVVGWHICYFLPPDAQPGQVYGVGLSVFERDIPLNGILYIQKPESFITTYVQSTNSQSNSGNTCGIISLPVEYQFTVQADEFIAVYISEEQGTGLRDGNILDIVGNTTNGADFVQRRCPRSDNTVVTAFDDYTDCLQTIYNHQIRARLLVSTLATVGPNSGLNDSNIIVPYPMNPLPQSTTAYAPTATQVVARTTDISTVSAVSAVSTVATSTEGQTMTSMLQPTSTLSTTEPPTLSPGEQGTAILVALSATGASVIALLVVAIVSILIAICIHQRRKAKLEQMKWRQERRNIMSDHFVLESELPAAMEELANMPQPYEEPLRIHIIGELANMPQHYEEPLRIHIIGELANQTYESERSNIPRPSTSSYVLNSEPLNDDEGIYCEASTPPPVDDSCSDIYESIDEDSAFNPSSPPDHIKALYDVVGRNNLRQSSIAQPRESGLYEHYYKTLEELTVESNKPASTERHFTNPANSENDLLAQFERASFSKIPSKDIKIMAHLGSGQFGQVSKGVWKSGRSCADIAVKSFTAQSTEDKAVHRVRLLQEAIIMGQFTNPNVIHFHAMVITNDTMMLVMELAAKGDLEHLLVAMVPDPGEMVPPTTNKLMLGFCQQVAFGMQYLSSKGFVHRDLAARNILVTTDNVLKIADFGMSRDLENDDYYISQGGKVPVKWTAPEAIHYKKYSTASDVWAYGCLLYEIWSLGQAPFRDYSNTEALGKVGRGYRLSPPPGCPRLIYDIMIRCWNPEASQRTPFKALIFELLQPEDTILQMPEVDLSTHQLASNIGGPLEAGEHMYRDLQTKYLSPPPTTQLVKPTVQ